MWFCLLPREAPLPARVPGLPERERKEEVLKCSEGRYSTQYVPLNLASRHEGQQTRFYVSSTETASSFLSVARGKPPRGI